MRRILQYTLVAGLALAPLAVHAQSAAYPTRDANDTQNGYYDHTGRWHANEANPYPDGYFDQSGQFHRYADANQGGPNDRSGNGTQSGGAYDGNGNWVPNTQGGGYYDTNGNWVPNTAQPRAEGGNGSYDRNGQWQPNDSDHRDGDRGYGNSDGRYNDNNGNGYGYGRLTGPERWSYSDRGRSETLDLAARNFALTADSVARQAYRHSSSRDRAAIDALKRLDQQASYFARAAYQRNRGETVGRAYFDLVRSFAEAQRRFANLRPDGWLANQLHVLASAMGRLDRRYFDGRAFHGQNPEYGGGYGYSQYDSQGRYPGGNAGVRPY